MNVTIEIPEDRVARFQEHARSQGLTVDRWLLELAERNLPQLPAGSRPKRKLLDISARVRGLAEDLDISRDPSPGRDVDL
jgi:hypothetical protein